MIWMLDTNIAIHFANRGAGYERIARRMSGRSPGEIRVSAITLAELRYGVARSREKSQNRAALEALLELILVEDFPSGAATDFGEIRVALEQAGTRIGPYDLLIAAHARHRRATLVSNDEAEFKRVPGLALVNWLRP